MEKNVSKFDEVFIKNYDDGDRNKDYILEVHVEYPKNFLNLHGELPLLWRRKKLKNAISLFVM